MRTSKKSILAAAFVGLSVPATIAIASVSTQFQPKQSIESDSNARDIMLRGYTGDGRPMDGDTSDIPYGDLRAFDKINTIGVAQSPDVPYCDIRSKLTQTLGHDFAEKPRLEKTLSGNRSVELWASKIMGTWTAVYTRADGVSCVVSSGMNWTQGENPVALLHKEGILPAA